MKDCVSLDIARQLKEAGWPQHNGEWGWWDVTDLHAGKWIENGEKTFEFGNCNDYGDEGYAAPTIGELLEVCGLVELKKLNNGFYRAWNHKNDNEPSGEGVENPADALGLLLLALVEKGIVKL